MKPKAGQKRKKIGRIILQEFMDNVKKQPNEVFESRFYLNGQWLNTMLYPKHAQLLKSVYEKECKTLTKLEEQRNDFCDKLTEEIHWKEILIEVYCKMTNDLLNEMPDAKINFEEIHDILKNVGIREYADRKTKEIAYIARAYAFLFEHLEKDGDEGALTFEFVSTLNKLIEGEERHSIDKKSDLNDFLGWVNINMKNRSVDTVTLATIGHCGVIKMQAFREGNHRTALLVQNFVLMKQCYPGMAMGADDIEKFKNIFDKGKASGNRYLRGVDISPSMRFLFKCLQKTLKELLESIKKAPLQEQEESAQKKKAESVKLPLAGGSRWRDEETIEESRASPTGTNISPYSPMQIVQFKPLEEDEIVDKSISMKEYEAKKMKLTQADDPPAPSPPYIQFGSLFKAALRDFNKNLLEYPKDLVEKEPNDDEEFRKEWGLLRY